MTRRQKVWDCLFPTVFILICMAASSIVVLLIAGLVTHRYDPTDITEHVHSVSLWASLLAYILTIFFQRKNFKADEMRFGQETNRWKRGAGEGAEHAASGRRGPGWKNVLAVVLTAAAGQLWSTLISLSGLSRIFTGYTANAEPAFVGQNPVLLIAATVVFGPIAEEITFRGMTYRRIRCYLGKTPALFLTSALFGLYHGNVIQFIYAFVIGLILGEIYEKSGSLRTCVAAHMAVNLCAILING